MRATRQHQLPPPHSLNALIRVETRTQLCSLLLWCTELPRFQTQRPTITHPRTHISLYSTANVSTLHLDICLHTLSLQTTYNSTLTIPTTFYTSYPSQCLKSFSHSYSCTHSPSLSVSLVLNFFFRRFSLSFVFYSYFYPQSSSSGSKPLSLLFTLHLLHTLRISSLSLFLVLYFLCLALTYQRVTWILSILYTVKLYQVTQSLVKSRESFVLLV